MKATVSGAWILQLRVCYTPTHAKYIYFDRSCRSGRWVCRVLLYTNKKQKDANWSGEVIDKAIQEQVEHDYNTNQQNSSTFSIGGMGFGNNTAVTHSYKITVKGDDGTTFDWDISSGMYDQINIGDKLVKHPGTKIPEIVAKASAPKATEKPDASQLTPPSSTPPVIQ